MSTPTDLMDWLREQIAASVRSTLTRDPLDVYALTDALTAILALHGPWAGNPRLKHCNTCAGDPSGWPCDTLKALALAYQHRPGYRKEWQA